MGAEGRDLFSVFIDRVYTDMLEVIGSMIFQSALNQVCRVVEELCGDGVSKSFMSAVLTEVGEE